MESQLPYGLYDLDRLSHPIAFRLGRSGEAYRGIRKDTVHVDGRPVLVDAKGPFGNPTSDSQRTMMTEATSRALVVVYAPAVVDTDRLMAVLELTADRCRTFTAAVVAGRWEASVRPGTPAELG